MKEWVFKKSSLKREKSLYTGDQKEFILEAIKFKDEEGLELALIHNFNFTVYDQDGELIWFKLAKEALNNQEKFNYKALTLLAVNNQDTIYEHKDGRDLLNIAICKESKFDSYIKVCNLDLPIVEVYYRRYIDDLHNFKFKGDLNFLTVLSIYPRCDIDMLNLLHFHGLKYNTVFVGGDNILHLLARTTIKHHNYLQSDPNDLLTTYYLKKCEDYTQYLHPSLALQKNNYGMLPGDLTYNPYFFSILSKLKQKDDNLSNNQDSNYSDIILEQIKKINSELSEIDGYLSSLLDVFENTDKIQDDKLSQIEQLQLEGISSDSIPSGEEMDNLEQYLYSLFKQYSNTKPTYDQASTVEEEHVLNDRDWLEDNIVL